MYGHHIQCRTLWCGVESERGNFGDSAESLDSFLASLIVNLSEIGTEIDRARGSERGTGNDSFLNSSAECLSVVLDVAIGFARTTASVDCAALVRTHK